MFAFEPRKDSTLQQKFEAGWGFGAILQQSLFFGCFCCAVDAREARTAPWEQICCPDFRRVAVLTSCSCSLGHFQGLCVSATCSSSWRSPPHGALPLSLSPTSPFPEKVKENKHPEHLGSALRECCFGRRRCFSFSPPRGSAPQPKPELLGLSRCGVGEGLLLCTPWP